MYIDLVQCAHNHDHTVAKKHTKRTRTGGNLRLKQFYNILLHANVLNEENFRFICMFQVGNMLVMNDIWLTQLFCGAYANWIHIFYVLEPF